MRERIRQDGTFLLLWCVWPFVALASAADAAVPGVRNPALGSWRFDRGANCIAAKLPVAAPDLPSGACLFLQAVVTPWGAKGQGDRRSRPKS